MKNFFNAIGVADMEKVHSAMIAWILDDENDPTLHNNSSQTISSFSTFTQKERSELLCNLFNVPFSKPFQSIKTFVEWNDIDIMIETEDNNGAKEVWVIENKLKSQEHLSNEKDKNGIVVQIWQTVKYENIINTSFANHQKHYMLLSLSGDNAQSSSGLWQSYTYERLHTLLSQVTNIGQYVLVQEYIDAIGMIVTELNNFLKSNNLSKNYPHVFNKLSKAKKADLQKSGMITPKESFIVENGLETIFQKQFLAKMINNYLHLKEDVRYDERNGTAMFIVPIQSISDFELNIEFQGGTYKVGLLHKDYIKDDSWKHTGRLYGNWDENSKTGDGKVFEVFSNLANNVKYKGWKIGKSKNLKGGKAKPRIALDKNIGAKWYMNPQNAIVTVYQEAVHIANDIFSQIPTIP